MARAAKTYTVYRFTSTGSGGRRRHEQRTCLAAASDKCPVDASEDLIEFMILSGRPLSQASPGAARTAEVSVLLTRFLP